MIVALAALAGGCGDSRGAARYAVMSGTVVSALAETGEFNVEPDPAARLDDDPAMVACVLTTDSEVYVNARLVDVEEITLGDRVEIIGQWQRDRLVAAMVRVRRTEPIAPIPEILTAAEWPPPEAGDSTNQRQTTRPAAAGAESEE